MGVVDHQHSGPSETGGRDAAGLAWALHHLAASWAAGDALVAKRLGLTPTDYLALKHLMVAERPFGPAELSRRLGMSTGSVNALVDRLQARGHVDREPHPSDRRRLVLSVSPACRAAIVETLLPLGERIDRLAGRMTDRDVAAVLRFLEDATRIHRDHFREEEAAGP